jgi:hypothetical protein
LPSATPKPIGRAEAARNALGLTLAQAAEKARVCTRYLRSVELHGGAPSVLAYRLAFVYKQPIDLFILRRGNTRKRSKKACGCRRKRSQAKPLISSSSCRQG